MAIHATRLLSGRLVIIIISAALFIGAWQLLQEIQESKEHAAKQLQMELNTLNQDNLALSLRISDLDKQVVNASELEALKSNLETVVAEEKALREELLAIKAEITKHVTAEKLTQEAPASTEEITPDNVNRHVAQAREFVKGMMKHAWGGYVSKAWGSNEVNPIAGVPNDSLYQGASMGATILDALDTLLVMGMIDEYKKARQWIKDSLRFDHGMFVSTFETSIRVLGGLLSAYAMTHDKMYVAKATDLADRLSRAFSFDEQGEFLSMGSHVNLVSGGVSGTGTVAEFGTMQLEFEYLSDVSGNPKYRDMVLKIRDTMDKYKPGDKLYGLFYGGRSFSGKVTFGGQGDSFYEYLLKGWVLGAWKDDKQKIMYYETADAFIDHLWVDNSNKPGKNSWFEERPATGMMEHLACFAGAMYALGAKHSPRADDHWRVAKELTSTCHSAYQASATKLCAERFQVSGEGFVQEIQQPSWKEYILRPETVESYMYLHRLTGDNKYRTWGWEMVQALEQHAKAEFGYSCMTGWTMYLADAVHNVWVVPPPKQDWMPSFFIAETLKYLYLLFSEETVLPLDRWVFNTEAHPFPIVGFRDKPLVDGLQYADEH